MSKSKLSNGLKNAQARLLNQNSKKILNNVYLLYIVLIAVITDLLYLVSSGANSNIIVFVVVAYVASMFSRNMTVVLITALAITNIYHLGRGIVLKEGFEEGNTEETDKTDETDKADKTDETDETDKTEKKKTDKKKTTDTKTDKLPEEYKKTLEQLSDPETLKTIEGLKSLEPLIGKMERVIGMFN